MGAQVAGQRQCSLAAPTARRATVPEEKTPQRFRAEGSHERAEWTHNRPPPSPDSDSDAEQWVCTPSLQPSTALIPKHRQESWVCTPLVESGVHTGAELCIEGWKAFASIDL